MAEKSSFFNSVNGDRRYQASDFADYFNSLVTNGVFPDPSTNLQVLANNDMTATVKAGRAWAKGYHYLNDSDLILSIDIADGVLNRIDRIVIRMDTVARNIAAVVKKGTFASSPVAPTLQRDADAFELGIADVYIAHGATSIVQANITDLRMNTTYCGWVNSLIQVDTTAIFDQYLDWYNTKTAQYQTDVTNMEAQFQNDFTAWFSTVKGQLIGDIGANLASQIANINGAGGNVEKANKSALDAHSATDATETVKGHVQLATPAETTAGTNGSKAVHPAGLKVELDKKLSIANYNPKDIDNGRYQSEFGFENAILNGCNVEDGNLTLGTTFVNTWDTTSGATTITSYNYPVLVGRRIYCISNSELVYYDIDGNVWVTAPTNPSEACSYLTAIGTKIYGRQSASPYRVFVYDTLTDTWDTTTGGLAGQYYMDFVACGTKIYAREGYSPDTIKIYDTVTKTWSSGASGQVSYWGGRSVAVGTKIYYDCSNNSNSKKMIAIYDTVTNTFSMGAESTLNKLFLELIGTKIYCHSTDMPYDMCVYDTATDTWSYTGISSTGLNLYWSVVVARKIYCISTTSPYRFNVYTLDAENLIGTGAKIVTPADLKKWGNLKWTQATPTNTSVVCDILSSTDIVLKSNITSIADLSDIDITAYPSLKTRWKLTRNAITDTTPTVGLPSWTWEGERVTPSDGAWEYGFTQVVPSSVTQVDIVGLSMYRLVRIKIFNLQHSVSTSGTVTLYGRCNGDTTANYNKKLSDRLQFTGNGSDVVDCSVAYQASSFIIEFNNVATMPKNFLTLGSFSGGMPGACSWSNITNLIDKLSLYLSANSIKDGAIIEVWGVK